MQLNPLDNAIPGIIAALAVEAAAVIIYTNTQWRWRALLPASGMILLLAALGLDFFFETNREQLIRITHQIVKAAQEEQPRAIIYHLGDDFTVSGRFNKSQASQIIKNYLNQPVIDSNTITWLKVLDDRNEGGKVEFTALTTFDPKGKYAMVSILKTKWLFEYHRRNDEPFRLFTLQNTSINNDKGIDFFTYKPQF